MVDFNIDQIAGEIDSGSFNAGDSGQQQQMGQTPINQPSFDPNLSIPYKANGKEITEPLSTVIQRASMGYNYAQLMQQYKQQQAELDAQRQQISQAAQKWQQYDEYANSNPEWAEFVRQSWESRSNFGQNQNQGQQSFDQSGFQQSQNLPPEVARELSEMKSFINQYKAEQQARMQAEQDAELAAEVSTIQNEYPDIDLKATDPMTGESVEQQILRHAQAHGISSFRAAFRDMMFEKLLARGQTQAKEVVAKNMQQQVKNGILGQSTTPMLQQQQVPSNLSGHSYHSLMDIAAKELGLN
jgi:hypothetical protein